MKNGKLDDVRIEELVDGLMDQFRVVRDHPVEIEMEMKIYDSMSNGAGKILKAYMVDIALQELSRPKIAEQSTEHRLAIEA